MYGTSYFWDLCEPLGLDDTEAIEILEEFGFSQNDIMLLFFHPNVYLKLSNKVSREYLIARPKWCKISTFAEGSRAILRANPPNGSVDARGRDIYPYKGQQPAKILEFCARLYKAYKN